MGEAALVEVVVVVVAVVAVDDSSLASGLDDWGGKGWCEVQLFVLFQRVL